MQLSATTTTRSGRCVWSRNESKVAPRQPSSLWAGISTVIVTGPAYTPRVSAITSLGASGMAPAFALRRARVVSRRSSNATPAPRTSASPVASTSARFEGSEDS